MPVVLQVSYQCKHGRAYSPMPHDRVLRRGEREFGWYGHVLMPVVLQVSFQRKHGRAYSPMPHVAVPRRGGLLSSGFASPTVPRFPCRTRNQRSSWRRLLGNGRDILSVLARRYSSFAPCRVEPELSAPFLVRHAIARSFSAQAASASRSPILAVTSASSSTFRQCQSL